MHNQSITWNNAVNAPKYSSVPLGRVMEYWDSDPAGYEGWEQLRDRRKALGRTATKSDIALSLSFFLLSDVIVAAGGLEQAIGRLRDSKMRAEAFVKRHNVSAQDIPMGIGDFSTIEAWYAFSEVLTWTRTVVERLERRPLDRKMRMQGLIPALKPKRLKAKCEKLKANLNAGPVGQVRHLSNLILHGALLRDPRSGAQLELSGKLTLPVPDIPPAGVKHWYLLTWTQSVDGFDFADELWTAVKAAIDDLIKAFDEATPRRIRLKP
jgi:hypothetical protein